ncbi:MAG: Na/Pi cotransporter family protein [Bacteroidales bacterium]|nr:Na/Pi cotransporter family protein [Bacteroidales bacterium]
MSALIIFKLLGSLALLMFGMKSMSDALQKMAGPQLRHVLGAMTTNRFTGMLTGIFVTAAVQSSTATTLMTVSFVNAGLLTLVQAISVILGAHIGTTVTAWIMSLGFSFNITDYVYPMFFFGIILIYMKKHRIMGDFLFGVAFLFLGLGTLRATGSEAVTGEYADVVHNFFQHFNNASVWTSLLFLLMGTVLTLCVQSSAAIMAITMTLCSTGVLHIDQGIMLVLGENIGTTITSNIVALSANTSARRAAFAHLSCNCLGVLWVILLLNPFTNTVFSIVGFDRDMPYTDPSFATKASMALAAFHSAFNVSNTLLLIWFVPFIERFVCKVIRPKTADGEEEDFKLHFITAGVMKTPELSVLEAEKEICAFAERMQRMFGMVKDLLNLSSSVLNKDKNRETEFTKLFSRIEKYEKISDNMELEIAQYLESVSDAHLSDETKGTIRAMLREVSELESIGDSCYNMARTINRKFAAKQDHFIEKQYERLYQMIGLIDHALSYMNRLMSGRKEDYDINQSFNLESEINNYRNHLKAQNIFDVNNHEYTYAEGTIYIDLVNECEKLGDYVVNVVEARTGVRQKNN